MLFCSKTHEDAFGEHEYSNEEPSSKNNFPHLETSFNADKFKLCNQYNPEPGSFEVKLILPVPINF